MCDVSFECFSLAFYNIILKTIQRYLYVLMYLRKSVSKSFFDFCILFSLKIDIQIIINTFLFFT